MLDQFPSRIAICVLAVASVGFGLLALQERTEKRAEMAAVELLRSNLERSNRKLRDKQRELALSQLRLLRRNESSAGRSLELADRHARTTTPLKQQEVLATSTEKLSWAEQKIDSLEYSLRLESGLLRSLTMRLEPSGKTTPASHLTAESSGSSTLRQKQPVDSTTATPCFPNELWVHCKIRARLGDRTTLYSIRRLGSLFDEWLAAAHMRSPVNASFASSVIADGDRCGPTSPSFWSQKGFGRSVKCVRERAELLSSCPMQPPDGTPLIVEMHGEALEFGYELVQVVPYAYAACLLGVLRVRSFCAGMRPFYFFAGVAHLDAANEVECDRRADCASLPNSTASRSVGAELFPTQHKRPSGNFWQRHPPFLASYNVQSRSSLLLSAHDGTQERIAFIANKRGILGMPSWAPSGTANSFSVSGLRELLDSLEPCFDRIVYFRANAALSSEVSGDGDRECPNATTRPRPPSLRRGKPLPYLDVEMIRARRSSKVIMLHELIEAGPRYTERLNSAQLVLAASARVVVTVQGGGAVLSSIASSNVVMLCRAGHECSGDSGARPPHPQAKPDAAWWSKLNNASFVVGEDESSLSMAALVAPGSTSPPGHSSACSSAIAQRFPVNSTYRSLRVYRDGLRIAVPRGAAHPYFGGRKEEPPRPRGHMGMAYAVPQAAPTPSLIRTGRVAASARAAAVMASAPATRRSVGPSVGQTNPARRVPPLS